jgi:hypothetical protein
VDQEIYIILDNSPRTRPNRLATSLLHPQARLHFTAIYSSCLWIVESWFAKIARDLIARGAFNSVPASTRQVCSMKVLFDILNVS